MTWYDKNGRRQPPSRDLPGWVWALVMLLVLVGCAWVGVR